MKRLSVLILVLLACSPRESYEFEQWGELKEVLALGKSEGRIALDAVCGREHAYGIGALEALGGEILVWDGEVLVSRSLSSGSAEDSDGEGEMAALLALAEVPEWSTQALPETHNLDELEALLSHEVRKAKLNPEKPIPFLIEGQCATLGFHVIGGFCPVQEADAEVYRSGLQDEPLRLMGFYFEGRAGILTHHGSRSHIHALMDGNPRVGHVESLSLRAGAILSLPQ